MIKYLGEHKLFNEKYIIFVLFCIFLVEFKNCFSYENKEKGYTLVISLMYLGEAILFLMPYENYIVDIMCTIFGIALVLCLILRYKSRKG
jgi:regulator of protease activity HflC (stomatin/prohibitin superfamily)